MAFAQIVEDRDGMLLVEELFCGNAADISSAADNENFHSRESPRIPALINRGARRNWRMRWRGPGNGSFLLRACDWLSRGRRRLFVQSNDHLLDLAMFGPRGKDLEALLVRAPLQDVDIDRANAPTFHFQATRLVKIDRIGSDKRG